MVKENHSMNKSNSPLRNVKKRRNASRYYLHADGRRRTKDASTVVESKLPRLAKLTDDQFDTWMKKTLLSGFADKILNEIAPPPPVETEGSTNAAAIHAYISRGFKPVIDPPKKP